MKIQVAETELELIQGNITQAQVDAIVNAANSQLIGGSGVNGAIRRAGGDAIEKACAAIRAREGGCPTGKAVLTTGGDLHAKYVIHTPGPVWKDGSSGEPELLASCYRESLRLAVGHNVRRIAFPSISTGIFGYPIEKAARVALAAVQDFVETNDTALVSVQFILFDEATYTCYVDALHTLSSK